MIAYTPTKRSSTQSFIKSPIIWIALGGLVLGLIIIRLISHGVYTATSRALVNQEDIISPAYQATVAKRTDVIKLAEIGERLLKKGLFPYAALNFQRASDLDPFYRDMAYGWGYALLQAKQGSLTKEDLTQLHAAITRAEKSDPLYPPLLQLKLAVAKAENNTADIALAEARLKLVK